MDGGGERTLGFVEHGKSLVQLLERGRRIRLSSLHCSLHKAMRCGRKAGTFWVSCEHPKPEEGFRLLRLSKPQSSRPPPAFSSCLRCLRFHSVHLRLGLPFHHSVGQNEGRVCAQLRGCRHLLLEMSSIAPSSLPSDPFLSTCQQLMHRHTPHCREVTQAQFYQPPISTLFTTHLPPPCSSLSFLIQGMDYAICGHFLSFWGSFPPVLNILFILYGYLFVRYYFFAELMKKRSLNIDIHGILRNFVRSSIYFGTMCCCFPVS